MYHQASSLNNEDLRHAYYDAKEDWVALPKVQYVLRNILTWIQGLGNKGTASFRHIYGNITHACAHNCHRDLPQLVIVLGFSGLSDQQTKIFSNPALPVFGEV